jgi:hypothetical protein
VGRRKWAEGEERDGANQSINQSSSKGETIAG